MSDKTKTEDDPYEALAVGELAKWARGRSLAELEATVLDDEPLFDGVITRFNFDKKSREEIPVLLRIPAGLEIAAARVEALTYMQKLAGRSGWTWEDAHKFFGPVNVEHIENLHILAIAIRRRSDPKRQYMTPAMLDKMHPNTALAQVFEQLGRLKRDSDMRLNVEEVQDERSFWGMVAAIAKSGGLGPLVVTDTLGGERFTICMAQRLYEYRTAQLSPPSSERSMRPGSPPSSDASSSQSQTSA